jgi:hypothetical protein
MKSWHPDPYSIYFNWSSLTNFGLGFDRYQELDEYEYLVLADSFVLSLLFFNVTITRWRSGSVWKTSRKH